MGKKKYDSSFKSTIVELLESGKSAKELAQEYSVSLASINRWKREFLDISNSVDTKTCISDKQRIKALEKELKDVRIERDILKKAVSIFSVSDK